MGLFAEGVDVETPMTALELLAKRSQAAGVDAPWAEEEAVRGFLQQEPVARSRSQRVEYTRREGHLAPST